MRNLQQLLVSYARYHRDARNIRSHFLGIPMIVLAVIALLARMSLPWGSANVAYVVVLLAVLYYLWLSWRLGLCMAVFLLLWGGEWLAALPTRYWLATSAVLLIGGWGCQLLGHVHEGRRPAFVDDLSGLVIGPLFVMVECFGWFGWLVDLRAKIEREAGPVTCCRRGR